MLDLAPVFSIPLKVAPDQEGFHLPIRALPRQLITGEIVPHGSVAAARCSLRYKEMISEGRNGEIWRAERKGPGGPATTVVMKRPKNSEYSLTAEALIQWRASEALKAVGILGAVPQVLDIFQYAGETRFSMDYIDGVSAVQALLESAQPDTMWLQILAQAALLLGYLEEVIQLDHRDLKADNIWIRRSTPVSYSLKVGGTVWALTTPFQVVLLDFGFACLGDSEGKATVSLSDGVVPKIDVCPKEGRDLFQFIASMWSIPAVRERAGKEVVADMTELLSYRGASYMDIVKRGATHPHWIYWAVSEPRFRHPPLHPLNLLHMLTHEWYPTVELLQVAA